jgi:1-acyl-sn-glycerol-3-phosphate acyltransferase
LFTPSSLVAQSLLTGINLKMLTSYHCRIPHNVPVLVVSNHRSFLDAAILITALPQRLRIACHHYMGKTPIIRELVHL